MSLPGFRKPEISELVESQQLSFRYDLRSDLRSYIRAIVKDLHRNDGDVQVRDQAPRL